MTPRTLRSLRPDVSILVPTLKRPHNILRFMDAVRQTSPIGTYKVVFVTDPDDLTTTNVIQTMVAGLDVDRLEHGGTFPQKINAAAAYTDTPFVLCCGDDVTFKPDWLDAAKRYMGGKGVIGTNDLTPRTQAKNHATAQIVDRDYIDGPGAAWKEPGHVFHEGYNHNYADDELCGLAIYRDEWVFADDCIIEHRHPCWGTEEVDEVYEKGQEKYFEDRRHFSLRRRMWLRSHRNYKRR